jgi:hypothetical protein
MLFKYYEEGADCCIYVHMKYTYNYLYDALRLISHIVMLCHEVNVELRSPFTENFR